jgi:hypothetical protein
MCSSPIWPEDENSIRLGPGILPDAGDLPTHLETATAASCLELMMFDLGRDEQVRSRCTNGSQQEFLADQSPH